MKGATYRVVFYDALSKKIKRSMRKTVGDHWKIANSTYKSLDHNTWKKNTEWTWPDGETNYEQI